MYKTSLILCLFLSPLTCYSSSSSYGSASSSSDISDNSREDSSRESNFRGAASYDDSEISIVIKSPETQEFAKKTLHTVNVSLLETHKNTLTKYSWVQPFTRDGAIILTAGIAIASAVSTSSYVSADRKDAALLAISVLTAIGGTLQGIARSWGNKREEAYKAIVDAADGTNPV